MILESLLELRALKIGGSPPSSPAAFLLGASAASGVKVDANSAVTFTAVYAAVRVLAESVASLPLITYRRRDDGGKERAPDHPLYRILHDQPNADMTSMVWREVGQTHLGLWGNHYSEIERNLRGDVVQLGPIKPDRVTVERVAGQIRYFVSNEGRRDTVLAPEDVLHVPALSFTGLVGLSPISVAREAVGLGLATQKFGASFFGNAAIPSGVLTMPSGQKELSDAAKKRLRDDWERIHKGTNRTALLEDGMTFTPTTIPPDDAQFLETRRFQVQEVARIFRVPPHMLGDLERATFSNIEHQAIEFVVHTVRPWLVRWEQEISRKLIPDRDRGSVFVEHLVDGLLRGDVTSRYQAYSIGRNGGWLSANDVRTLENMNPIDTGGDLYMVPLNMQSADLAAAPDLRWDETQRPETRATTLSVDLEQRSLQSRFRLADSFRPLITAAAQRVVTREARYVEKNSSMIAESKQSFSDLIDEFFEQHAEFARQVMAPVLLAYQESVAAEALTEVHLEAADFRAELERFAAEYAEAFGRRHAGSFRDQIRKLLEGLDRAEVEAAVRERAMQWEETAAERVGRNEATQAGSAISKLVYVAGGVTVLRWMTSAGACPLCQQMSGRAVEVRRPFLQPGEQVEGDEDTSTLQVQQIVGHPPLHAGCSCSIAPG